MSRPSALMPKSPPKRRPSLAQRLPCVVAAYGAPRSGVSTVLAGLHSALLTQGHVVGLASDAQSHRAGGFKGLEDKYAQHIWRRASMGYGRACLLIDGLPENSDDVQHLFDLGWVTGADGLLLRIDRPGSPEGMGYDWGQQLYALEARARLLTMPITVVVNGEGPAATGATVQAALSGLTRWARHPARRTR